MNTIQLFGCLLIGGLAAGEVSRRILGFPRTTGFVLFGLAVGQSGLGWVEPMHLDSARLFIDLALGLILFELGHRISPAWALAERGRLYASMAECLFSGVLVFCATWIMGFPLLSSAIAAAVGISTSPAITIATSSDVGAKGAKTEILFTLVAINGAVAFALLSLVSAFSLEGGGWAIAHRAAAPLLYAFLIGGSGAVLAVHGARRLGRHVEHQHVLLLGLIVLAVGSALALDMSVLLPLLLLGMATRMLDRRNEVAAIRISSDARLFLVITFVLAGAALDIRWLAAHWSAALVFVVARWAGKFLGMHLFHRHAGLDEGEARSMAIGLMPMSSVALVLVSDMGRLYADTSPELHGMLMASILFMQLLGPPATQFAIREFGEATLFSRPPRDKPLADGTG